MEERISMTGRDLDRQHILRQVIDGQLTQLTAGQQLGLSDRQVRRLVPRLEQEGPAGLIHRLRGHSSNRQLSQSFVTVILARIRERYPDFGPTFAQEKLREDGWVISIAALRQIMIAADIWRPKRRKSVHRDRRERRASVGELIQFDGSYHAWFEERGPTACLLLAIDDATGKLMDGVFTDHERVETVMHFWREYLLTHGRPIAIYLDRHSVYQTNRPVQHQGEPFDLTQFERAMEELAITLIHAYSPQAKGRVERSFDTHQDRLVKELRLAGISDPATATRFFREVYLPSHNQKFAVEPRNPQDAHRPLRPMDDLERIFSVREPRIVARDFTIRYQGTIYQLTENQPVTIFPKDRIMVEIRLDQTRHLLHQGQELNYREVTKPNPVNRKQWVIPRTPRVPWVPPANHPWRKQNFGRPLTAQNI